MASSTLYQQALARIQEMQFTPTEIDFIFSDWPEGDEHLNWLLTATRDEIVTWGNAGEWGIEPSEFGTATHENKIYNLLEQATPSCRIYWNDGRDADEGDVYYTEYQALATDSDSNLYLIRWQFQEIKGQEIEDAENFPWDDEHITEVLPQS